LRLLTEIKTIGLSVVVGYLNSEALLYRLVPELGLCMGSFENTRMFSMDKFLVSSEDRRGPRARIYLPGLFNWIQFNQAKEIREFAPEVWEAVYTPTEDSERVLEAAVDPVFNQPGLYKHHFRCMSSQLEELSELQPEDVYQRLRTALRNSQRYYRQIEEANIDLEPHGQGEHVQGWLNAINRYYREYLQA
jgi:hypothetical protein